MRKFLPILFGLLVVLSCQKKNELVIVNKSLEEFDTLVLHDVFDVELTQGTTNSISVETSEKFQEKIALKIKDKQMDIENNNKALWLNPRTNKVKLRITTNGLHKIIANETCTISSTNELTGNELGLVLKSKLNHAHLKLNCDIFYYWNNIPCGGKLDLAGNCKELKLWNCALMTVDASTLSSEKVIVENSSKGKIQVQCSSALFYAITGEGDILVKGNPSFIKDLGSNGKGRLIFE